MARIHALGDKQKVLQPDSGLRWMKFAESDVREIQKTRGRRAMGNLSHSAVRTVQSVEKARDEKAEEENVLHNIEAEPATSAPDLERR